MEEERGRGRRAEGSPCLRCPVSWTSAPSFLLPSDVSKRPAGSPVGEQSTSSLDSLCGLCRHDLTQTPLFLSTPHSSLQRITLLGLHAISPKCPHLMECLHHPPVLFFSAWSTFPLAQTLRPLGALADCLRQSESPRHPHASRPPAACTL